jgi:glucosylceramidase
MRPTKWLAAATTVSAVSLVFEPRGVLAACSSWSSLYVGNLDGVCVCNATQCDLVSNDYLNLTTGHVGVFTTSQAGARLEYTVKAVDASPVSSPTFSIDASTQYQSIIGFGGAFTDSAAINVYKLSPELQQVLLDQYFSETGLQYNLGRVSIGSNDFSTSIYSYNDVEDDLAMENFSIDVDKAPSSHKIQLLQRVLNTTSRDIKLFASSWAPPAWMTKENSTINCHLKGEPGDENWEALALYYSKFFDAYKEEGIHFWAMTVQNEPEKPLLAFAKWQTLRVTPGEERDFIKFNLGPMMAKNHPDVKIIANDDQKPSILTRLEPLDDPEALQYISGVAVHWYRNVDFVLGLGGHFDDLVEFHDSYPDLFILPTEACEGYMPDPLGTGKGPSLTDPDKSWTRGENYGRDIIGDLNSYAAGWTDWNLVLDTDGGPNWAKNKVDAPILVDAVNGGEFYKQPMFYFMGHFAKFIPAGSRRVKLSLSEDADSELQSCAFVTAEDQVVAVFLNLDGSEEVVSVQQSDSSTFTLTVPAHSIVTAILPPSAHTILSQPTST